MADIPLHLIMEINIASAAAYPHTINISRHPKILLMN
jgi:hypothetical protein